MTSKERVRAVMMHQKPDRIPAAFQATDGVMKKLIAHYGVTSEDDLYKKFDIDIIPAAPTYCGAPLKEYTNSAGAHVITNYWHFEATLHETEVDTYRTTTLYPLEGVESMDDLNQYSYPSADDFDYSSITKTCEENPDKAIIIGHEGPFQIVTNLMNMEEFFILMMEEPEVAHEILDRMVAFELEYYERCLIAGGGKIDILRPHDDYGTQISLLFSTSMWEEFFAENTKKLVELTHRYGAFYMQHSCGAVGPIIPGLVACGIDALEPIQKVKTLEIENLLPYAEKLCFHGGIDTQDLLPNGTPEQVTAEVKRFIEALGKSGSYILMGSQSFEPDAKIENIEAIYSVDRTVS
ncbi:MAG: uroporphyrinogen decarboxylase family protein [Faecalibacterium sp.]